MRKYDTMTDEELIYELRSGNTEIAEYIVDKYKSVVRGKAKAMYLLGGDNDDLIQEGMIGLFKAVRDYDPSHEASFYHFASICISRQMYTAIKLSKRQKHIPLNSYVSLYESGDETCEEKQSPLIEQIQTRKDNNPEDLFLDKEYMAMMMEGLQKNLSDLEKKVLHLHLLGEDYKTISRLLEKSPKSIDNALQRIKGKVSRLMKET